MSLLQSTLALLGRGRGLLLPFLHQLLIFSPVLLCLHYHLPPLPLLLLHLILLILVHGLISTQSSSHFLSSLFFLYYTFIINCSSNIITSYSFSFSAPCSFPHFVFSRSLPHPPPDDQVEALHLLLEALHHLLEVLHLLLELIPSPAR